MIQDEKVLSDIEEFGWHVIKVAEDAVGPGFAYNIGLTHNFGHPELIILGLASEVMHQILNLAGDQISLAKEKFKSGMRTTELLEGYSCCFVDFPKPLHEEFLGYCIWFYKNENFEVLQCVWPDKTGNFPWEAGAFDEFSKIPPVPGKSIN
jgi:hypothetical protein